MEEEEIKDIIIGPAAWLYTDNDDIVIKLTRNTLART